MAVDYTTFQNYPIEIKGINESYNDELNLINDEVVKELNYSGDEDDLSDLLPYFIFYKFCENRQTEVTVSGESAQASELTYISDRSMVRAWNKGAKMLNDLCDANDKTADLIYLSERNLI